MCNLGEINVSEGDVIHLSLNIDLYNAEEAKWICEKWKEVFPKNDVMISFDNHDNSISIIHKNYNKTPSLPF